MSSTAKSDFLTAVTGSTAIGSTKAFSSPNASTDRVTCTAHGKETGFGPVRLTTSNTLPAGLTTGTDYYLIAVDANTLSFATSKANALAGTKVDITDTGTGTFAVGCTMATLANALQSQLDYRLTAAGVRSLTPATNQNSFWAEAVLWSTF